LRRNETYVHHAEKIIIEKHENLIAIAISDDNCMMSYLKEEIYDDSSQNSSVESKLFANSILTLDLSEEESHPLHASLADLEISSERRIRYTSKKGSISFSVKLFHRRFEHLNLQDIKLIMQKSEINILKEE